MPQYNLGTQFLTITWPDGFKRKFAYLWLKDNESRTRHKNGQKLSEPASLPFDLQAQKTTQTDDHLRIDWNKNNTDFSEFSLQWLRDFKTNDSPFPTPICWEPATLPAYQFEYSQLTAETTVLHAALEHVIRYGFAVLRDVPVVAGQIFEVVALFGFVRETNYGRLFEVRTVENPNNLAFTSLGLSPHTDNPYRHPAPTLQLLHCLQSEDSGGESILVDGFSIAEKMRAEFPTLFERLAATPVRFQFHDERCYLEAETTLIGLSPQGTIRHVRCNNRSMRAFDPGAETTPEYYEAYLKFMQLAEEPEYQLVFQLKPGDLILMDNERVMHGRKEYSSAGGRHLQGCYADMDGLRSKYAMLAH